MRGPISAEIRHVLDAEGCWEGLYINGTLVVEDEYIHIDNVFNILRNNLNIDAKCFVIDGERYYEHITQGNEGFDDYISYPKRLSELESFIEREELGE